MGCEAGLSLSRWEGVWSPEIFFNFLSQMTLSMHLGRYFSTVHLHALETETGAVCLKNLLEIRIMIK